MEIWKNVKTRSKQKNNIRIRLEPLQKEFKTQMKELENLEQKCLKNDFERSQIKLTHLQKLRKIKWKINEEANKTKKEIEEHRKNRKKHLQM